MSRKYYTLAVRDAGVWSPQFGDYEREVVVQEREDSYSMNSYPQVRKVDTKIVISDGTRKGVEIAIAKLNEGRS